MQVNINELLSAAYDLVEVKKTRAEAIGLIRAACQNFPEIRPFLEQKRKQYQHVHDQTYDPTMQRSRDHVGSVLARLLAEAL